jgi:hypothetical protein
MIQETTYPFFSPFDLGGEQQTLTSSLDSQKEKYSK